MDERRAHERYAIQLPINVSTPVRKNRVGMIRDVSVGGVWFHSKSRFAIGERVELMFRIGDAQETALGEVVRADDDKNFDNLFRWLTAVRFDRPLPAAALGRE